MNVSFAVVLIVVLVIAYTVYDHGRNKRSDALSVCGDRIDALEKRLVVVEHNIVKRMDQADIPRIDFENPFDLLGDEDAADSAENQDS